MNVEEKLTIDSVIEHLQSKGYPHTNWADVLKEHKIKLTALVEAVRVFDLRLPEVIHDDIPVCIENRAKHYRALHKALGDLGNE